MPSIQKGGEERVRLSLDVNPTVKAKLEALQQRTDAGSATEVIRRALALYDLVTEVQTEGGTFVVRYADGEQERIRVL